MKPWEENNGYYGILSRLVKQFSPSFIFTVKTGTIDHNYLNKDQIINHFNRNGTFTTKVSGDNFNKLTRHSLNFIHFQIGLCTNLRNLPWFAPFHADDFFPRCYKLSQEDDKMAFIGL